MGLHVIKIAKIKVSKCISQRDTLFLKRKEIKRVDEGGKDVVV